MYAIINKRTGKYLFGTDFRFSPPHQRTSDERALTFENKEEAEIECRRRKCSAQYKIIKIKIEIMEEEEEKEDGYI